MSAKSGEGEHGDAGGGGEDEGVRFTRRVRRRGCGSGRWSRKSGPGGARTKVSAGARRGRATTSASGGACVLLYWEMCSSSHVKRGKDTHGTTGPESGTRGMRGSKPAGFTGVGERAARSLDRVSRRRGPRRAAGASLEQRDLLDDVCRVREHSRGHDAGEVVGEVVRRVEAAVGGAVAPALPA